MSDDDDLTAPYVPAPTRVQVFVTVGDRTHEGVVLGWRGSRVFVHYRGSMGMGHQTWVPAADVVRVPDNDEAPPA